MDGGAWWATVPGVAKSRTRLSDLTSASQVALVVKNPPANAGDMRDVGSIPGLGRSSGKENGNPPQYSCQENAMDGGALYATVNGITKSHT